MCRNSAWDVSWGFREGSLGGIDSDVAKNRQATIQQYWPSLVNIHELYFEWHILESIEEL